MGSQSRGHHRQRSEDEKMRIRKGLHNNKANTLDIFSTSPEKPERQERRRPRPRRNSDTSVLDVQEVQRKDGSRNPDDSSRSKKPSKRVDTIDKLDLTGLYGPGRTSPNVLTLCHNKLTSNSIPSRRPLRCLQSSSQPQRSTGCANGSLCRGLFEHVHGRRSHQTQHGL